jgi:TIR domain/Interferon-induced transmembrane protein
VEIFLSYARPDRLRAESVAQRLRQAGNNVWLDTELAGGQAWWDQILLQLRQCDVAVVLISWAALRSQPCIHQRRYAASLGKTIIPLAVEPVDSKLLPPDLARLQVIDYCNPSEEAAYQLIGAIMRLPAPGRPPDPLPEPPPLPTSPLDAIAEQLAAPTLGQDRQLAIIGRLESALDPSVDSDDKPVALELLGRMANRPDLLAAVDRRIAALQTAVRATDASRTAPPPRGAAGGWDTAAGQASAGGRNGAGAQSPAGGWTGSGNQGGGGPWPQAGRSAAVKQPSSAGAVSPNWAMAITAVILFFPVGIPAVVYASRTRSSLAVGDVLQARKAASVVKVLFWITIAIWVIAAASRA